MPKVPQSDAPKMVPYTRFEEYSKKYEKLFILERTESGVLTAKFHTDGGPAEWELALHRGIHQLCSDVGQDAETEVFIFGGSGDRFLVTPKVRYTPDTPENMKWKLYEHNYYDGCRDVEALVNYLDIPTIGVINGPAMHAELALLCDITLMADDAYIMEPHFHMDIMPGDGVQIILRELMGVKRANYAMLFNQAITPQMALDVGLVNEVVPRDKIYDRARELGEILAAKPRITRRVITQTLRCTIREQIAKELRPTFGTEMWGNMTIGFDHGKGFNKVDAMKE